LPQPAITSANGRKYLLGYRQGMASHSFQYILDAYWTDQVDAISAKTIYAPGKKPLPPFYARRQRDVTT